MHLSSLRGKTVLITGAAGGFGAALASRLALHGAKLVLGDVDDRTGAALASTLNRRTGTKTAVFQHCDVVDFAALRKLFELGLRDFGGIHVVVNNAGIAERKRISADDSGEWRRVLDVDLTAVIEGTRLALEFIDPATGGVVVNVASVAGIQPLTVAPVYTAAKFGVVGFSAAVAMQAKERNVRVNCVAPSFAETNIIRGEMANKADMQLLQDIIDKTGKVAVGQVIDAIMRLIEDDSLTGEIAMVTAQTGIRIRGKTVAGGARNSKSGGLTAKASL